MEFYQKHLLYINFKLYKQIDKWLDENRCIYDRMIDGQMDRQIDEQTDR